MDIDHNYFLNKKFISQFLLIREWNDPLIIFEIYGLYFRE
jgi:hypothetical protein